MMRLQILLPTEVLIDEPAARITADAENGSFCLLPRHVNFVTSLAPGILAFIDADSQERILGVAEGILVKSGRDVRVSVEYGVLGDNLGELCERVRQHFALIDEREREAVSAVARLEADFVRRFLALEDRPYVG